MDLKRKKREVKKLHETMMGIPCPSCWTGTKAFCLSEKENLIYLLQFNPGQAWLVPGWDFCREVGSHLPRFLLPQAFLLPQEVFFPYKLHLPAANTGGCAGVNFFCWCK